MPCLHILRRAERRARRSVVSAALFIDFMSEAARTYDEELGGKSRRFWKQLVKA